jgi:diguanylate cyclase (GGDEF)-like protein
MGGSREVSGTITGAVVGYVRRQRGDAGVRELLSAAGEDRSIDELEDASSWGSYAAALRLFEAADALLGEPDVARRVGAHVLDQHAGTEVATILRSLGTAEEVLKNVATTAAKHSAITSMDVLEIEQGFARVAAVTRTGVARDRHFCDYTAGVLSQCSALFGDSPAEVTESECQRRGDARCLYEVRWQTAAEGDGAEERRIRDLEMQLAGLTARFEALQATATAFVTARNADEVLATITKRAGSAARAPQFLLAVQLPAERWLRVHHEGFASDADARRVARELLSGTHTGRPTHLIVEVASARSRFGVLAAIHPEGTAFFPQERHLLEAYAAHAAAALEVTSALEDARRQNGTARALLHFGRSLAGVASVDEIVGRLTAALPAVVDSDAGAVLLWDEVKGLMCLRSTFGLPPEIAEPFDGLEIRVEDTPVIIELVRDREPVFIDPSTDDPFLAGLMSMAEMQSAAVVPIVVPDGIVGLVAVGRRVAEIRSHPDVLERLTGMADLAATAFANARFLDRVQTEALQDPLTGLANARQLARTAERALAAQTPVALLFVDLDGFKPINDELGHDAGDDVLRTCGSRLKSAVRDTDTVARIGGDEFVVLMPNAGPVAAAATAARLRARLLEPITVEGRPVALSGSVGIAQASTEDDFRSLLKRADDAMYIAKGRRSVTSPIDSETVDDDDHDPR